VRAASIGDFSFPFIQSEFTFLVPAASAIRQAADADKPGIRIAAVRSHASTATLTSVIKQAEVVLEEGEQATFELLRAGRVHATKLGLDQTGLREAQDEAPGRAPTLRRVLRAGS
jgi:polar amino acid transport system substrate-binding protein